MSHKILRRFYGCDYAGGGQGLPALPHGGGLIEAALPDGEEIVTVTLAERRSRP